jgi:hypothetical protein
VHVAVSYAGVGLRRASTASAIRGWTTSERWILAGFGKVGPWSRSGCRGGAHRLAVRFGASARGLVWATMLLPTGVGARVGLGDDAASYGRRRASGMHVDPKMSAAYAALSRSNWH